MENLLHGKFAVLNLTNMLFIVVAFVNISSVLCYLLGLCENMTTNSRVLESMMSFRGERNIWCRRISMDLIYLGNYCNNFIGRVSWSKGVKILKFVEKLPFFFPYFARSRSQESLSISRLTLILNNMLITTSTRYKKSLNYQNERGVKRPQGIPNNTGNNVPKSTPTEHYTNQSRSRTTNYSMCHPAMAEQF